MDIKIKQTSFQKCPLLFADHLHTYIYIIKDAVPTLLFHYAASFSLKCNCKHGKHWILLFHPLENPLPLLGQTPSKESEGPFCLRDHRAKPPGTPQRLECSSKQFWKKKNPPCIREKSAFFGLVWRSVWPSYHDQESHDSRVVWGGAWAEHCRNKQVVMHLINRGRCFKDAVPTLLFHYAASFSLKCNCKHGKHWILLFHPLENPPPLTGPNPK